MTGHGMWGMGRATKSIAIVFFGFAIPCLMSHAPAYAAPLPSLFRGVVVTNASGGVRVVTVDEGSQAQLADVRPEDLITQINDTPVRTIDEFAVASSGLKGRVFKASVWVLRRNEPLELSVHLYSYPILQHWGLRFVAEYDIRFAEPAVGRQYWMRLGRGFETAKNPEQALNAYLNALHNDPESVETAIKIWELLRQVASAKLASRQFSDALASIQQGTLLLNHLFDHPLTPAQLDAVKTQLAELLKAVKAYRPAS